MNNISQSPRHVILNACLLFILIFFAMAKPTLATTYEMGTSSNWNIALTGPSGSSEYLGWGYTTGDFNNDGKPDIVGGAYGASNNSRANSGSIYLIFNDKIVDKTGTGNTVDLGTSSNFNLRIDGAAANDFTAPVHAADVNNNGIDDLIIAATGADNNASGGSVYILFDSMLDDYTSTTGNTLDLNEASSFNIRFDGKAGDGLGGFQQANITIGDINGDDKNDLVLGGSGADNNSLTDAGSAYIIYNNIFGNITGTGNTIDLTTASNYHIRYDGAAAGHYIGEGLAIGDINGDGSADIALTANSADYNSLSNSGSLYIVSGDLIGAMSGTGNNVSLGTSTNYTIRYDGAVASALLGKWGATIVDLNADGDNDIVANGDVESGVSASIVIYNSLVSSYFGSTGNNVQLSDTTEWNIAFNSSDEYVGLARPLVGDLNHDEKLDIVLSDSNYSSGTGAVAVIFNDLFEDETGTGNIITLTDENIDVLYLGSGQRNYLGNANVLADINNDGQLDVLISESDHPFSSTFNGVLYVVYYFPHTFTLNNVTTSLLSPFTMTGNVSATNNPTTISKVQWGHQRSFGDLNATTDSDFLNAWIDCSPTDGSFDSNNEDFFCNHSALTFASGSNFTIPHTVFFRAQDTKGIWTDVSKYPTTTFSMDQPASSSSSSSSSSSKKASIQSGSGGVTKVKTSKGSITSVTETGTMDFNVDLSVSTPENAPSSDITGTATALNTGIPTRISQSGKNHYQLGDASFICYRDFHNGACVLPELQRKPSIVALSYTEDQLFTPGSPIFSEVNLKLAKSTDGGKTWTILPTSVVDTENNTVAALDRIHGIYMIVRSHNGFVSGSSGQNSAVQGTLSTDNEDASTQNDFSPDGSNLNEVNEGSIEKKTSNKKTTNQSFLQRVISFIKGMFQ